MEEEYQDDTNAESSKYINSSYSDASPEGYALGSQAEPAQPEQYNPNATQAEMDAVAQQAAYEGYSPEDQDEEQFLGFSEQKPKEGVYALFNKVLNLPVSTKVGNVDKLELGDMGISVREGLRVALLGKTFGHTQFATFFANQANIITDTSMAKKGWFSELFVSSKRFMEKSSGFGPGSGSSANSQANLPEQKQSKIEKLFLGKKS